MRRYTIEYTVTDTRQIELYVPSDAEISELDHDSLIQEIYAQEDEGKSLTLGDGIYEVKRIFSDGIMEPVRMRHTIDDPFEAMDPEKVYDTIFNAEAQDFEDSFFEEVDDSDFDDEEKDLNR